MATRGIPFGTKTVSKSSQDRRYRMELAIRFFLLNPTATTSDMADHVGVSTQTINFWRQSKEWKNLHNQLTTGVLDNIDSKMFSDVEFQRMKLKRMVPLALQNLATLAMQQTDKKLMLEATKEILDREGNLSKVSRVGVPTESQGGTGSKVDSDVAAALMDAYKKKKTEELATTTE